jgi:hypothetical protein
MIVKITAGRQTKLRLSKMALLVEVWDLEEPPH